MKIPGFPVLPGTGGALPFVRMERKDRDTVDRIRLVAMAALSFTLLSVAVRAQFTPAPNAVKLPDSLVFVSTNATTNSSLVWHPGHHRYHALRPGMNTYPLETWLPSGGLSISQTTCGVDTRGMWYNPGTAQLERNCFSGIGWATLPTDGALNATNGFTMLFTGALQPNIQSVGAFDPTTNSVLFYNAGNLYTYSRATATLTSVVPLTGAVLTNVAAYFVFYTGQVGYEVGLYDCTAKRVLLFNKNTGAFTGQSQLPASAVATTPLTFRFAYTNNRFWLFNSTLRKWNAYCIWNQVCGMVLLPVELIHLQANCWNGVPVVEWATASERNSSHFFVERSADLDGWSTVARVEAAGNSQQRMDYAWHDPAPLQGTTVHYRLTQVDLDGASEVLPTATVAACDQPADRLRIMPNPVPPDGQCTVVVQGVQDGPAVLLVVDAWGRSVQRGAITADDGTARARVDLSGRPPGIYLVQVLDATEALVAAQRVVVP